MQRPEIPCEEVIRNLWEGYQKTAEYKNGRTKSINSAHPLVREAEAKGLHRIIINFVNKLKERQSVRDEFCNRQRDEWLSEWKEMHDTLFSYVLKNRGAFRKIDVRFGAPGDEELHKIPSKEEVVREIQEFAHTLSSKLKNVDATDIKSIVSFLSKVHYEFVRIHPFPDGNGRIARVITDQLAVSLGLPPIIAGFPRTNAKKKAIYHDAMKKAAGDPGRVSINKWIGNQVTEKLAEVA